jgi:cytochrome c oxidase accessory protein FixG
MKVDLPNERLTTTTETGKRIYVYPQLVHGFWQRRRAIVYSLLVFFFLAIPWIRLNGRPILLLDVIHRKFNIFGFQFWATDVPMVVLVFLIFAIGIALITSVFGRAWCGWSCPQTVYIDVIYRRIEHWVEGDALKQKKLDSGPLTAERVVKKSFKWTLFIAVSWIISHSFLAYFIGSEQVLKVLQQPPSENWGTFQAVWFMTALVAFDFGWFRDQFCTIVCPYGRFQSVMMDQNSLIVQYDVKRGEPRGSLREENAGDCVDCGKCVNVCPTGIDIRRGLQMECIACTACIDACDTVMEKIHKPAGLIRFDTENGIKNWKIFQPRTFIYLGFLTAALTTLIFLLNTRDNIEVTLLRAHDDPYRMLEGATSTVLNHFKLKLRNRNFEPVQINFQTKDQSISLVTPIHDLTLAESEEKDFEFFVSFPKSVLHEGRGTALIEMSGTLKGQKTETQIEEATLIGPF